IELFDQFAAERAAIAVDDHNRHVLDVRRRGIAQHRELDDRRNNQQPEKARALTQLRELFPHQRQDPRLHRRASLAADRPSTTDANTAIALIGASSAAGPRPFKTTPRNATRKYFAGTTVVTYCKPSGMLEIGKMKPESMNVGRKAISMDIWNATCCVGATVDTSRPVPSAPARNRKITRLKVNQSPRIGRPNSPIAAITTSSADA